MKYSSFEYPTNVCVNNSEHILYLFELLEEHGKTVGEYVRLLKSNIIDMDYALIQANMPANQCPAIDVAEYAQKLRDYYKDISTPDLLTVYQYNKNGCKVLDLWIPRAALLEREFKLKVNFAVPETAADVRELYGHLLDAEREPEREGPDRNSHRDVAYRDAVQKIKTTFRGVWPIDAPFPPAEAPPWDPAGVEVGRWIIGVPASGVGKPCMSRIGRVCDNGKFACEIGWIYNVKDGSFSGDWDSGWAYLIPQVPTEPEGQPAMWDPERAVAGTWVLADAQPGEVAPKVVRIGGFDKWGDLNIDRNFYSPETGRRTWEGETGRAYMLAAPTSQEDPPTWDPDKVVAGRWVLVDEDPGNKKPYMAKISSSSDHSVLVNSRLYYPGDGSSAAIPGGSLYMLDLTQ